jgi:hypothetical protein
MEEAKRKGEICVKKFKTKDCKTKYKIGHSPSIDLRRKRRTSANINSLIVNATTLFEEYSPLTHRVPELSEQHITSIFRV